MNNTLGGKKMLRGFFLMFYLFILGAGTKREGERA